MRQIFLRERQVDFVPKINKVPIILIIIPHHSPGMLKDFVLPVHKKYMTARHEGYML